MINKNDLTKGFTLIELIVVIAIIAVLVLLAMPKMSNYQQQARLTNIKNSIRQLENASERYYMEKQQWPKYYVDETNEYTAEILKTYSTEFINFKGEQVELDANGKFYLLDYSVLNQYVKVPKIDGAYIIQNPVGEVYYLNNLTELGQQTFGFTSSKNPSSPPKEEVNSEAFAKLFMGNSHAFGITNGGQVYGWGYNYAGQLGVSDNSGTATANPNPILLSIDNVKLLAPGNNHTLALKNDGTVYAWGDNSRGQLGNGTTTASINPVQVTGLSNIKAIAGGSNHSVALATDGKVYAWGLNADGQLGDDSTTQRTAPVESKITDVVEIAAGGSHTVARKANGTVWVWGQNWNGQVGINTSTASEKPTQVINLTDVKKIVSGNSHILALTNNGDVYAWGQNNQGQIGDGTTENVLAPKLIFSNAKDIAAGSQHSVILKNDGTVYAFGNNFNGEVGNGSADEKITSPTQVAVLTNIKSITAAGASSMAISNDGKIFAWGKNSNGQLGDGTTTVAKTPVEILIR